MRGCLTTLAVICVLATLLGFLLILRVPFGFEDFVNSVLERFKCDETCIWMITLGGILLGGFFLWLASKCQNRK